jgi:hypothetical protein
MQVIDFSDINYEKFSCHIFQILEKYDLNLATLKALVVITNPPALAGGCLVLNQVGYG